MADPVSAVGLVAAAVQLTELAVKVVKRISDFNSTIKQTPKAFQEVQIQLPLIIESVGRIKEQTDQGLLSDSSRNAVYAVIEACQHDTRLLDKLITELLPNSTDSIRKKTLKALTSLTHDKEINKITEALRNRTYLLALHKVAKDGIEPLQSPEPCEPFWLVPFDRNVSFVGRHEIFEKINEAFIVPTGSQSKAALTGLGGIGKSQIALEYCHRRREQNCECSIFWVNAATVAQFEESLNNIAVMCGLVARNSGQAEGASLVQPWLEFRHQGPWMMVVDNANERDIVFNQKMRNGKTPWQCIPRRNGTLIFTTRSYELAYDLARPSRPIYIPLIGEAEGVELIQKRLGLGFPKNLMIELLEELDHIPLAITQAVSFMIKRRIDIPQYLERFRKSDDTKMRMLDYEFIDHGRTAESPESVAKTWELSFNSIREDNQKAADMLYLISFFQNHGIPERILRSEDDDEFDFEDAMTILSDYSFVNADNTRVRFHTHSLVQHATRHWLRSQGPTEVTAWRLTALKSLAREFPEATSHPKQDYWETCEILLPHAESLLAYDFKKSEQDIQLERARLLNSTGRYIHWIGRYSDGRKRFRTSWDIRKQYLGEAHVDTLKSMGLYVWALSFQGEPEAVEPGYRLLELRQEILGPNHADTIDCLSDLATALAKTNQYAESIKFHRDAVSRGIAHLGINDLDTLNCQNALASTLMDVDEYQEASEIYKEVYEIKKSIQGPDHPDFLVIESNFALCLVGLGEIPRAIELNQHCLASKEKVLGIDHPETIISAYNLGDLYFREGHREEAIKLYDRIIDGCEAGLRRETVDGKEYLDLIRRRRRPISYGRLPPLPE